MPAALPALLSATSLFYQLASWVFLRIIPARAGTAVLPTLYAIYFGLWVSSELERVRVWKREREVFRSGAASSYGLGPLGTAHVKAAGVKPSGDVYLESVRLNSDVKPANGKRTTIRSPTQVKESLGQALFRTLCSFPTRSPLLNALPLLVNTTLLFFVLDLLYTPKYFFGSEDLTFIRVGAVGHDAAKLTVRVPSSKEASEPVRIEYKPILAAPAPSKFKQSPFFITTAPDDFTTTVILSGLLPGVEYEYSLPAISRNGTFTTSPDPTLARSTGSRFFFLSTSCIKPNFPYSPPKGLADFSQQSRLAIPGFEQLERWLAERAVKPAFMLALGDWIYADTPTGAKTEAWFRRLYRQVYANEHVQKVLAQLPILAVWDDHEIVNNFAGEGHASDMEGFDEASSAYSLYLGDGNWHARTNGKQWYDFDHGDTSFFVMDTRPYRSDEWMPDGPDKTMLGLEQKQDFIDWLHKVNQTATFKFISTSVPFTSLWGKPDGHLDTWAGYLNERDQLMDLIDYIPNVIFLSGDRHEFAAVQLRGNAYEFSTSPLSQFYVPYTWTLKPDRTRYLPLLAGESETEVFDLETGQDGTQHVKKHPEEVLLKYLPDGNVKWGSFEVNTLDPSRPTVNFQLWIDSKVAWELEIVGESVDNRPGSGLAARTVGGIKTLLEDLGFHPKKWL